MESSERGAYIRFSAMAVLMEPGDNTVHCMGVWRNSRRKLSLMRISAAFEAA